MTAPLRILTVDFEDWFHILDNPSTSSPESWENFSINMPNKTKYLECINYPYQSIDSGLYYEKISNKNHDLYIF